MSAHLRIIVGFVLRYSGRLVSVFSKQVMVRVKREACKLMLISDLTNGTMRFDQWHNGSHFEDICGVLFYVTTIQYRTRAPWVILRI